MRKLEVIVDYEKLGEAARLIHDRELVFEADRHNEGNVVLTIEYDKEQESDIAELEEEIEALDN
jgi:hypothetical protein